MRAPRRTLAGMVILLVSSSSIGCEMELFDEARTATSRPCMPLARSPGNHYADEDEGGGPLVWEASDPRLSGEVTQTDLRDKYDDPQRCYYMPIAGVGTSIWEIANDGGRWVGTATYLDVGRSEVYVAPLMLAGERAYEGLSASVVFEREGGGKPTLRGLVFPGEMPLSPAATVAELSGAADGPGPAIAAAGPLGRSYEDWVRDYFVWREGQRQDHEIEWPTEVPAGLMDCATNEGQLLVHPFPESSEAADCKVDTSQRIFLAVPFICPRSEDPHGCFDGAEFLDVFVSVDGQSVAIDERVNRTPWPARTLPGWVGPHPTPWLHRVPAATRSRAKVRSSPARSVGWCSPAIAQLGRGVAQDEAQSASLGQARPDGSGSSALSPA